MTLKFAVETITPAKADAILENNPKNRRISDFIVRSYADDMKNGEWMENGETIKITENGQLIDGQHRLSAIILSGTTHKMLVVRGLSEEHIQTIDLGKKRSNADLLELNGYKNKILLSAAASICLNFYNGEYIQKKARKTPTRILNFVKKNPRLDSIVNRNARYFQNKKVRAMVHISLLCALYFEFGKINKNLADEFFNQFVSGENVKAGSPVQTLREKLSLEAQDIYGERGDKWRRKIITYFMTAFEAYCHGAKVTAFKYDEKAPVKFTKLKKAA